MKKILAGLLAGFAISSCAPSTPQARIAQNPEGFAQLSRKEQQLVQNGELSRGMGPEAVKLAWGPPSRSFEGSKNSKPVERWDYTTMRPVHSLSYLGLGGYGYGGYYGPYGRPGSYSIGPDVAYIPERVASVWFTESRVDAWERLR